MMLEKSLQNPTIPTSTHYTASPSQSHEARGFYDKCYERLQVNALIHSL
jgi:hypothetical protein